METKQVMTKLIIDYLEGNGIPIIQINKSRVEIGNKEVSVLTRAFTSYEEILEEK